MATKSLSNAGDNNWLPEKLSSRDGCSVPLPWRLKHICSPMGPLNGAKSYAEVAVGYSPL